MFVMNDSISIIKLKRSEYVVFTHVLITILLKVNTAYPYY